MEPVRPPEFSVATPPGESRLVSGVVLAMKVGLGILPGGSVLSEGLGGLVAWHTAEKTRGWASSLEERFTYHDDRLSNLESPEKAREVAAIAVAAGQATAKTHQEEKLRALQNAVLNTALEGIEGADERMVFVRYIDELTPTHLRMLRKIEELRSQLGGLTQHLALFQVLIKHGLPVQLDDCFLYFRELQGCDLVRTPPTFGTTDEPESVQEKLRRMKDDYKNFVVKTRHPLVELSPVGRRFLQFIEDPEEA